MVNSARVLLCVAAMLMAAVNGVCGHFESRGMLFENAAAIQVDSKSCAVTGAHEVCHTAEMESGYTVHVCPDDGECGNGLCYYSTVPPCCPRAKGLRCKSVSTLLIEGRRINVTHNRVVLSNEVCVSFSSDMKLCDEECRRDCHGFSGCEENLECDSSGDNCACREGFSEASNCCDCAEGYYRNGTRCTRYCREKCKTGLPSLNGQSTGCFSCFGGYLPPDCCNCPPGRVERDGECKCVSNLKPDGSCAVGTLAPDCCECDTTGVSHPTHAFYKTPSGECKPFCKNNCAVTGTSGCTTCKSGFSTEPECCRKLFQGGNKKGVLPNVFNTYEEPVCDPPQNLFFFIDATSSNKFENFCPLIVVLQMVVAAISPSATSGTQIGALLFSDNARHRDPSPVFDTDTSCLDDVQGEGKSLLSLMYEFGVCLDKHRNYDSTKFPSMCGEGTSAVLGLERIRDVARTKSSRNSTVLMITDGVIKDTNEAREKVLRELKDAGVTIIEAGYGDADIATMKKYTDPDNIMIDNDPIQLGRAIVNKLKEKGLLCDEYAKNVIENLERAQGNSINNFCICHRAAYLNNAACANKKYPVCGGDLSVGLNSRTSETQDLRDLEEEILAAVEDVLERFDVH